MESPAESAYVIGSELPLPVENLGDDAGRAENVQQVFLPQIICAHEFVEHVHGA